MSSHIQIRDFLHEVLANKAKAKLTTHQFDSIIAMADQITKFSEKGLLIVALTDQLHKMSNVNYFSIKKFMNEFLTGLKPQKPKKQREAGQVRRRRPRPVDTSNGVRNLDQMAQQSVSHPSIPQMARIGADGLPSHESQSNKISQNGSKVSDLNKRDLEFANQLNKISEGLEYQHDYDNQQEQNIQEYSKSSSNSSQSFGVVSNISQKMDLLRRKDDKGDKKTKTIRRPTTIEATVTKKKARTNILDAMLTLQKTRATLNQSIYLEDRSISYDYEPWLDQYHEQNEMHNETYQQYLKTVKEKPLSALNNMSLSAKKNAHRREMFQNIDTDFTQFDTGYQGQTMHDFTSQPIPDFSQPFESQLVVNQLSIFQQEDVNPTITEISQRVNRPEALVFYEMLAKMQKGELIMTQENPRQFSEIRIELLRDNS